MGSFGSGLKKIRVAGAIGRFAASSALASLSAGGDPDKIRKHGINYTSKYSRVLLDLLGVHTTSEYSPEISDQQNYFMVCNHMSYLDILVLSAIRPSVFITSVEMRQTFFLGDIANLGGSFFVNRRNRKKIKEEVKALEGLVARGFDVFLFPEGTSSSGTEGILPFKKSLFRVPFNAGMSLIPICLRYTHIDGEPFGKENCDKVAWHGDMSFGPHLNGLTRCKQIKAHVKYMAPVKASQFESHGELSQHMWELVSSQYDQF